MPYSFSTSVYLCKLYATILQLRDLRRVSEAFLRVAGGARWTLGCEQGVSSQNSLVGI